MAKKDETVKNADVKNEVAKRGSMSDENIEYMIDHWNDENVRDMAKKFGCKESTVLGAAARVRKLSAGKACPIKKVKKEDSIKEILKKKGIIS